MSSQPSEPGVVDDHVRLRQHQMLAITYSGVPVGGSAGSCELRPGGGSAEMISNRRSDANRKVLVKCVGEHLLPTAQTWRP